MLLARNALLIFLLILLTPAAVSAAESMTMVQFGISGYITTPGVAIADLDVDGEDSYILGTSTGLYAFGSGGVLEHYIQTSSPVTSIAVMSDITGDGISEVVISTGDIFFPNVICYDLETGDKIWDFSPRTEVYDPFILWTMKQTGVFDMSSINDINGDGARDVVLSSGYNIHVLDGKSGEELWKFSDTDNVWDLLVIDDQNGDGKQDVMAGDQNGFLHLLSGADGDVIWKKYLVDEYDVVNPSTNSAVGTVRRSVWDIVAVDIDGEKDAAVSAEDGYVYLVGLRNGEVIWRQEVVDYVDTLLYSYYGNNPLPTGSSDYNFFNLRIAAVDDVTGDGSQDLLASTFPGIRRGREYKGVEGVYLLDGRSGEMKWKNENIELSYVTYPKTLELGKEYIAIPAGRTGNKEKVRLIDPVDGSTSETLSINSTSSSVRMNSYFLETAASGQFVMASSYGDFMMVEYPGSIVWSYPRINGVVIKKADLTGDSTTDMLVKSRDGGDPENPFDEGQSRIIYVLDGATKEVAWSYELPREIFLETGGLSEVRTGPDINSDGKSDILSYLQYPGEWDRGDRYGSNTRILIFSGRSGALLANRSVIDGDYYGVYEKFMKDKILLNQTVRERILGEWRISESELRNLPDDNRKEFDRQFNERVGNILNMGKEAVIRKRIASLDVIEDQSGDGVADFLIGSWSDVFIMDSVKGSIVWNMTLRPDNYRDPFTGAVPLDFYGNWSQDDRNRYIVIGDTNDDGMDDLVQVSWDSLAFLHSNLTKGRLGYDVAFRVTTPKGLNKETVFGVGDLNENGAQDIVYEKNMEDAPPVFTFADGRNGFSIMEVQRSGTSIRLGEADFNGNGFTDTVVFQMWTEGGGPQLQIIDGRTNEVIWNYKGIEEAWMMRDIYGYSSVMPAASVGDVNGDGAADVAVARSQAWQPGAEVLVYDVKNNKQLFSISVEDSDETRSGDSRYMPGISVERLADINGDGTEELGVIAATGEERGKQIKMFVIDTANRKVISDFTSVGSSIINLGKNSVGMIGSAGNIYFLDTSKNLSITSPAGGAVTGSPINVEWSVSGEPVFMVLVDGMQTLRTEDRSAQFEISSGEHVITVYSFDRYGKGVYDHVSVNVVKDTSAVTLTLALVLALIVILFLPKISGLIMGVKR